ARGRDGTHSALLRAAAGGGGAVRRDGGEAHRRCGDGRLRCAMADDAERAVRAALRVLEAISDLNEQDPGIALRVRVGINTGEALMALGAKPEQGAGIVTGDVVNTAARLQGQAATNGIAVSERTYRGPPASARTSPT